jgi:alpha-D-xyloside xylohydrolase
MDKIPLFVKAGSIVPIGPKVQYATEKKWEAITIRIYPRANGEFALYEDENDNYNYEKGIYTTIKFTWDDEKKILTISDRNGAFPGMDNERTFNIAVMNESAPREVIYSGEKVDVVF